MSSSYDHDTTSFSLQRFRKLMYSSISLYSSRIDFKWGAPEEFQPTLTSLLFVLQGDRLHGNSAFGGGDIGEASCDDLSHDERSIGEISPTAVSGGEIVRSGRRQCATSMTGLESFDSSATLHVLHCFSFCAYISSASSTLSRSTFFPSISCALEPPGSSVIGFASNS